MSKPSRFEREISKKYAIRRQQKESARRGNIDPETMQDIADRIGDQVEELRAKQRRKRIVHN